MPVPEAYTARLTTGTALTFSVAAYPGQTFSGNVSRIAHAVDVGTRTMAVELDVNNSDGRLAPGTFCQVRWPVRRTVPSLLVPSGSVANTTGRTFVIRVRGGRTDWVNMRDRTGIGFVDQGIRRSESPGDEIATRGTDELRAGGTGASETGKARIGRKVDVSRYSCKWRKDGDA